MQAAPSVQPSRFGSRVLQFGIATLAIGILIYFAARSVGGGLAGVALGAIVAWLAFDLAWSVVRGIWRVRTRVERQHATVGGCLAAIAACCGGGLLLTFGYQVFLGLILGAVLSVVSNRTALPSLAQMAGINLTQATTGGPSISQFIPRPVAAVIALLCVLGGIVLGGLGSLRAVENVTFATDYGCAHPCGMVAGLWVQVLPDSHGAFVTRLDQDAVQLRVRFWNDVAGDKTVDRTAFTLTIPPRTFDPVANRQGCDQWEPRILHLDGSAGPLTLCFAIPQAENLDFSQLELDWAQPFQTAPILLRKEPRSGWGGNFTYGTESSPSPSPS